MWNYVLRRLGYAVLVVWISYTVSFVLLYLLPSDPVSILLNQGGGESAPGADPEQEAELRRQLGLDRPALVQYFDAIGKALTGDLGTSVQTGRPVTSDILEVLPNTIVLGIAGLVAALLIGVGLTFAASWSTRPLIHKILAGVPALLTSFPLFWVALLLLQIFAFQLGWFPPFGNEGVRSLVLPALTIGLPTGALYAHLFLGSVQETLQQPYIDTAFNKGLHRFAVLRRHVFRNAVIPVFTILALTVGDILAGAVVTETIFNRVGIGKLLQQAVNQQDLPVVQALVLFFALSFALCNLFADLVYPLINPQIALERQSGGARQRFRAKGATA